MKKGQVTIFIILGLLIVSVVVGAYYVKDYIIKSKWERLKEYPVPEQAQGIKDYVDACVREVGGKAVELAGLQAGFVNVKEDAIPIGELNLFSNGLYVFPKSKLKVPYWYYEKTNGIQVEQIPSLVEITEGVKNYMDNNLLTCLGNFEDFKDYTIRTGNIDSEVDIKEGEVLFSVNMPVYMKIKDFEFNFQGFYEKTDAPLKDLYETAKNIYDKEKADSFLEEKVIDFMVIYPEIPFSGTSRDCTPQIWIKDQVIKDFKNILVNNIPQLVVKGTDYTLASEDDKYFVIDANADKDTSVSFLFSDIWPFKLEVAPEEDGFLKSESISESFGKLKGLVETFVCLNTWHFVYDIKFPILITLSKNGYTFQFASQVIIDNNEPKKNTLVAESIADVSKNICENKRNEWTIYTLADGNPLNDVSIKFKCINHLCDVGKTKLGLYDDSYLAEKLPICINGAIIGSREGYHFGKEIVSTNEEGSININLEPLKELNAEVVVQRAGSGEVRDDETVYITLTEEDKEYSTSIVYPDEQKVKLIPGNYKVSIMMVSEGEIEIPSKTIEKCVKVPEGIEGIVGKTEKKCITFEIPSMELDKTISGKADFDLMINTDDLTNNKIIFHVPYKQIKTYEDLQSGFGEVVYPEFE